MEYIRILLPLMITSIIIVCLIKIVKNKTEINHKEETYLSEGMAVGLCIGVAIGVSSGVYIGYFMSVGLLVGCIIGMFIKK